MCIVILCNVLGLCIDTYSYKAVQIHVPHPFDRTYKSSYIESNVCGSSLNGKSGANGPFLS